MLTAHSTILSKLNSIEINKQYNEISSNRKEKVLKNNKNELKFQIKI